MPNYFSVDYFRAGVPETDCLAKAILSPFVYTLPYYRPWMSSIG